MKANIVAAVAFAAILAAVCVMVFPQVSAEDAPDPVPPQDFLGMAEGGSIVLDGDVVLSGTVEIVDLVSVDLAGHSITNATGTVFLVQSGGSLTITDSVGGGAVECNAAVSGYNAGAVRVMAGGEALIEGGEFSSASSGGYLIMNDGGMEVRGGVFSGSNVSLVCNGYYDDAEMTISGGRFSCSGNIIIKNEENGILIVTGGEFSNHGDQMVQNWNQATISGGDFDGTVSSVTYGSIPSAVVEIVGGTFSGEDGSVLAWNMTYSWSPAANDPRIIIRGGIFNDAVRSGSGAEGAIQDDIEGPFRVAVYGGVFSEEPAEGMIAERKISYEYDGYYLVLDEVQDPVIIIADIPFASLDDALVLINANGGGFMEVVGEGTLRLMKDMDVSSVLIEVPAGSEMTIDLNGHDMVVRSINVEGSLTLEDDTASTGPVVNQDGTVEYEAGSLSAPTNPVYVLRGGVFTLSSGILTTQSQTAAAIDVDGNDQYIYCPPDLVNTDVELVESGFVMDGGYVHAVARAVQLNLHGAYMEMIGGVVSVSGGAAIVAGDLRSYGENFGSNHIAIDGGIVLSNAPESGTSAGIVFNTSGTVDISGGSVIAIDGVGVLMRYGTLDMSGGSISSTGTVAGTIGNGIHQIPCAAVVIDGDSTYVSMDTTLSAMIADGTLTSDVSVTPVQVIGDADADDVTISGGTFSTTVGMDSMLEDGMVFDGDGSVIHLVTVGDEGYGSLKDAVDSVAPGSTIVLNGDDASTDAIDIDRTLTIDGQGFTFNGSFVLDATGSSEGVYTLTVTDLVMDGLGTAGMAVNGQNQSDDVRPVNLVMEDVSISGYKNKGVYLTNVQSLTVRGCTFNDNATAEQTWYQGDYAFDINLVGISGSVILIEDTHFGGVSGGNSPVKVTQRGGQADNDDVSTDIGSNVAATIASLTIRGCTFDVTGDRMADVVIGSSPNADGAARTYTQAFDVRIDTEDAMTVAYRNGIVDGEEDLLLISLPGGTVNALVSDGTIGSGAGSYIITLSGASVVSGTVGDGNVIVGLRSVAVPAGERIDGTVYFGSDRVNSITLGDVVAGGDGLVLSLGSVVISGAVSEGEVAIGGYGMVSGDVDLGSAVLSVPSGSTLIVPSGSSVRGTEPICVGGVVTVFGTVASPVDNHGAVQVYDGGSVTGEVHGNEPEGMDQVTVSIIGIADVSIGLGETMSVAVTVLPVDATVTATVNGLSLDVDGRTISWTPSEAGTYTVTVTAEYGGVTDTETFQVTVTAPEEPGDEPFDWTLVIVFILIVVLIVLVVRMLL